MKDKLEIQLEKNTFSENEVLTSTTIKNDKAVKTGKMYKASGVVRSVNQKAPPCLNDGIFSAMFVICNQRKENEIVNG